MKISSILLTLLAMLMAASLCACGEGEQPPMPTATQPPASQTDPSAPSAQPDPTAPTGDAISIQTCTLEVMNSAMEGEAELSLAEDGTFTLISGYEVTLTAAELAAMEIDGADTTYRYQTKMIGTWNLADGLYICSSGEYFATIIADKEHLPTLDAYTAALTEDQTVLDAYHGMLYDGEYVPYETIDGHFYDLKMELVAADNGFQVVQAMEYYEDGRLFVTYEHTDGEISTATYYYAFGGVHYIHHYENGKIHHTDYYDVDGNYTDTSYPDENGEY